MTPKPEGEALALAEPRSLRPLGAHCHLGLGRLSRVTGEGEQAGEHLTTATSHRGQNRLSQSTRILKRPRLSHDGPEVVDGDPFRVPVTVPAPT